MHFSLLAITAVLATTATASSLIFRDAAPPCDEGCCGLYYEDPQAGNGNHHIIKDAKQCTKLAVDGERPPTMLRHFFWTKPQCTDCKFFIDDQCQQPSVNFDNNYESAKKNNPGSKVFWPAETGFIASVQC